MTTYTRRDCLTWLNLARHARRAVLRRFCLRRALRLASDPNHAARIAHALITDGIDSLDALLMAMAWLEVECKVSALDFGPGAGIGTKHQFNLP